MNAPREKPDAELTPEAVKLVDAYFSRVRGALPVTAPDDCAETVENLRAHVIEELASGAGAAADVTAVLASLGEPEALAAQCADAASDEPPTAEREREKRSVLCGRVLGIPYELRPPTAERIASRWWDPLDPHVFVPRLFGAGWTVNFASVAVKLGIIRPDDEDIPFGLVPERWLAAALALPLALAAGMVALAAVCQPSLPASVPVHFSIDGAADGFASKGMGLALPLCTALLGAGIAAWPWLRRRPPLPRVASGALATTLATLSIVTYGQQAAAAHGGGGVTIMLAGLAASLALPFALLVVLSRIGRAAEQRRDMESTGNKGGV